MKLTKFLFYLLLLTLSTRMSGQVKPDAHKFVVIGDSQHMLFLESLYWENWGEHNQSETRSLFNEIAKRNPDFLIHLGDLTKEGGSESNWEDFDEDNKPVFDRRTPYYPVFGNHEYFGSNTDMYIYFYRRFPLIKESKWYCFIYEDIGFILINTNFDDLSKSDTTAQRKWYIQTLKEMENNSTVKKIIVAGHHPPYTNSRVVKPERTVERDYANPFIETKKGVIFFSGHCHSYERFQQGGKTFIVSGGGGGPRQKLNIDKTTRKYNDLFEGPAKRFLHFCEIQNEPDRLTLDIVKLNENGTFEVAEHLTFPRQK